MCIFRHTIMSKLTIGVNIKFGSHREFSSPFIVASDIILILYVPLGIEKKYVSMRFTPSNMLHLVINFIILSTTFILTEGYCFAYGTSSMLLGIT